MGISFPSHEGDDKPAASSGVRVKRYKMTQYSWCAFVAQSEVLDIQSHSEPLSARSRPRLPLPPRDVGSLLADSWYTLPHSLKSLPRAYTAFLCRGCSAHGGRLTPKTSICLWYPQCQKEMPEVPKALLFWQLSHPGPTSMQCHDVSHLGKQTRNVYGSCLALRDLTSMTVTQ